MPFDRLLIALFLCTTLALELSAQSPGTSSRQPTGLTETFSWTTGPPLVTPKTVDGEAWHVIKDPTIVRHKENVGIGRRRLH